MSQNSIEHTFMYGYKANNHDTVLDYSLRNRPPSNVLSEVIEVLKNLPLDSNVMNLGCGDGSLELLAGANRKYNFTSIDLEPTAITSLQNVFKEQHHSGDIAMVGDITHLGNIKEVILHSPFTAGVSWRVLHGISPDYYSEIMKTLHSLLESGANLFLSVACDQDWKAEALGDSYDPDGVNDCAGVMFHDFDIQRDNPFPVHFFSKEELKDLGEANGFTLKAIRYFTETSGYSHLKDRENTYLYAHFITK